MSAIGDAVVTLVMTGAGTVFVRRLRKVPSECWEAVLPRSYAAVRAVEGWWRRYLAWAADEQPDVHARAEERCPYWDGMAEVMGQQMLAEATARHPSVRAKRSGRLDLSDEDVFRRFADIVFEESAPRPRDGGER